MRKVLIINDFPQKLRTNYGNAIYIKPFIGNVNDNELTSFYTYLLTFKTVDNTRTIEKRAWETTGVLKQNK